MVLELEVDQKYTNEDVGLLHVRMMGFKMVDCKTYGLLKMEDNKKQD